jgi:isochorismate pyruvate lyase
MVTAQWRNMIGWFIQYEEEKLRQALETGNGNGNKNASSGASNDA